MATFPDFEALRCPGCELSLEHLIPPLPPRPISHVFQSPNPELSPAQGLDIRAYVEATGKSLQLLEKRIELLSGLLNVFETAKHAYLDSLQACKPLLRSHRRLPDEIWAEIFLFAGVDEGPDLDYPEYCFTPAHTYDAPLSVSHVCSRWRRISLSTPGLWSNIHIRTDSIIPAGHKNLLQLYFVRGRDSPMTFSLSWTPQEADLLDSTAFDSLLMLFASSSYRWEAVSLHIPSDVFCFSGIFPLKDCPRLIRLRCSTVDDIGVNDGNPWPKLILHSPRLQLLRVENFHPNIEHFSTLVPWGSLGIVETDHSDLGKEHFWHVLQSCPRLRAFKAIGNFQTDGDETMLFHPVLEELLFYSLDAEFYIMRTLTCPNLHSLLLPSPDPETPGTQDVAQFVSRNPSLTKLILLEIPSSWETLLPPESSIQDLILEIRVPEQSNFLSDVIHQLSSLTSSHLPKLRTVRFKFRSIVLLEDEEETGYLAFCAVTSLAIRRFAETRTAAGDSLTAVEVLVQICSDMCREPFLQAFIALKELNLPNLHVIVYDDSDDIYSEQYLSLLSNPE